LSSTRVRIASPVQEPPPLPKREVTTDPNKVEITESKTTPGARGRWPLIAGGALVVIIGVALGGYAAFRTNSASSPTPRTDPKLPTTNVKAPPSEPKRDPAAPTDPQPKVEPVEVVFDVESEPPGATVTQGGALLGTTPFSFSVWRSDEAPARAELAFALDGYQGTTVVAQGSAGRVPIKPALTKKKAVTPVKNVNRPKNPKNPNSDPGYKDDPYQ
jgi:hypothetical protein